MSALRSIKRNIAKDITGNPETNHTGRKFISQIQESRISNNPQSLESKERERILRSDKRRKEMEELVETLLKEVENGPNK